MEFNLAKFNKIVEEGEQFGFTVERAGDNNGVVVTYQESEFSNYYHLDKFNWPLLVEDFGAWCFYEGKKD